MIDTIVFDLGGVLVDWNPRYLYRKLFAHHGETADAKMEYFLANICTQTWNEQHDAGQLIAKGTAELIAKHPEHEEMIKAFYGRWPEMLGGSIAGTVKILERIRDSKKYRLLALSNWSAETFPLATQRFEFLKIFETVLLSGKEKLIKPDPRFFALLESRLHVKPENALFIDDVEKNIAAAKNLGFDAIRFESPEQLERDLKARNLTF
ncbi:MAG: HAD family phosphatase [Bdellovibrionota bacterium]